MSTLSRRRFLMLTGAGVVAVAAGSIALAVRQFSDPGNTLTFLAVSGLPAKPLVSYASYVITGKIDVSNGTGTITKYIYAGPPESMTSIPLYTRTVRVTGVSQQGSAWHITGVIANQAQLQKGEDTSLELQLDSSRGIAQSSFFGSPISLRLQHFTVP